MLLENRYELGEVIGTGGMSEVYEAQDTLLGRDVAVKMLRTDLARDAIFRERFRREANNAGRLSHPAIVSVLDTGSTVIDGLEVPYIVMNLVHGKTLRTVVREGGPMFPDEAARALAPICDALQTSHEAGIIHRDVKPANIMITNTGDVMIMDFGIARALNDATSAMTQTSAVIGTAQYLSPEQARGKSADARSDVYALGCVLYEAVTGQPPFEGETPFAVAYQHVQENPTPPSEMVHGLTPEESVNIDAVVLRAMAKDPDQRYQSAAEFGEDLQRMARGVTTNAARLSMTSSMSATSETTAFHTVVAPAPGEAARDEGTVTSRSARHVDEESPLEGSHRGSDTGSRRAADGRRRSRSGQDSDTSLGNSKRNKGFIAAAVVLTVMILTLAGFGLKSFISGEGASLSMVTLPDVSNQTVKDATEVLEDAGFQTITSFEPDPTVDKNKVLRTNPIAGSSLKKKTTVTIVVSSGPEMTKVPDLTDMTTAEAEKAIKKAGLQFDSEVAEDTSETVEPGLVIKQNPRANTSISKGSKVKITVSLGPKNVMVPTDLVGMPFTDASNALDALGFNVERRNVDSSQKGVVTKVSDQGKTLPRGSVVTLDVGNGATLEVPNLTGLTGAEAAETLSRRGWTGTFVDGPTVTTVDSSLNGKIARQTPAAGTDIGRSEDITVQYYSFSLLPSNNGLNGGGNGANQGGGTNPLDGLGDLFR